MALPTDRIEMSVEETEDAESLLFMRLRLGALNPDGSGRVEVTMGLKQGLILSAQLQLISSAQEVLRQLERALLTGDTTGFAPNTGGKA